MIILKHNMYDLREVLHNILRCSNTHKRWIVSVTYVLRISFTSHVAGKLVSNRREELSRVMETFNIQVDNPVVILNQETSRNFLHSKSPHDKYKVPCMLLL